MNAAPKFEETLRKLIATPSVSSTMPRLDMSNRAVCETLANWLEPLGFSCELLPVGENKANLIATRGRGDGGLVLSGHTDTVPFDENGWDSDPFALKENGDRWHGLGSCDMKGFLALCVQLAEELRDQDLKQPLIILATADEESGMDGAKALLNYGKPLGRHALIGEPTGLIPIRMHKGIFMDAVMIQGHAGHSSDPRGGVNAVEGIHKALAALLSFRDELMTRENNLGFSVPHATLNPGCIHGGDSPNRIPAACELQFDLRPLPGMDLRALRAEARARMDAALQEGQWKWQHEELFEGAEPFETAADAAIVKAAERLTDCEAQAVNFATEGGYLNQMGMQSLVLGPGSIDQAHQPNEYLAMDQITPMMGILRGLVKDFCYE
ncbi:MAG: acetylornithine deacetylase [Oceanococcus sp.]